MFQFRKARKPCKIGLAIILIEFMNKFITFTIFVVLIVAACSSSQTTNTNVAPNSLMQNSTVVSSHSQNDSALSSGQTNSKVVPKSETKTKWTQSGDPIDTTVFDAEIKQAENKLKAKPNDETLKKSLAEAFVKRGVALTDARQYASALGDYRRALKQIGRAHV